jgi:hypothetical protein
VTITCVVGIISFCHEPVGFQIVKSVFLGTAITSVIIFFAVDELFLRE